MSVQDVFDDRQRWACECADAIEFMRSLPDDSIDLLFTSPPFENARRYAGAEVPQPTGEDWVAWMVEFVRAAAPKVKGLIAINCEGRTKNFRYSSTPFLLHADLHRAGFNMRKPVVFHRIGIPGSGGTDWLRNDWEPIVCVTRPGILPWSDPTATGNPPKWAPGGPMSHRVHDVPRRNKWGHVMNKDGTPNGNLTADGKNKIPSTGAKRGKYKPRKPKVVVRGGDSGLPLLANPGNIVRCKTGGEHLGSDFAHKTEAPMPLKLAEFFILSFCLPGGIVCDPFAGSGTTCHAAVANGRRFVGCDIRQSQADLVSRRIGPVGNTN